MMRIARGSSLGGVFEFCTLPSLQFSDVLRYVHVLSQELRALEYLRVMTPVQAV